MTPNNFESGSETTMLKEHLINAYGEAIQKKTVKLQRLKKTSSVIKMQMDFHDQMYTTQSATQKFWNATGSADTKGLYNNKRIQYKDATCNYR